MSLTMMCQKFASRDVCVYISVPHTTQIALHVVVFLVYERTIIINEKSGIFIIIPLNQFKNAKCLNILKS